MTDYIATGRVVPERIAAIVKGIAEACVEAGCALVGGETAEHPGLLGPDEYDVAGATTGVVEADDLLGPGTRAAGRRRAGDGVSGLHSNGYSLVRHVLLAEGRLGSSTATSPELGPDAGRGAPRADPDLRQGLPGAGRAGPAPTRWRTSPAAGWPPTSARVHAARSSTATLDRGTWTPPAGLRRGPPGRAASAAGPRGDPQLRRRHGRAARRPTRVDAASRCSTGTASARWAAGEVAGRRGGAGGGTVSLVGQHPGWDDLGHSRYSVCGNSQPAGSVGPTRN